MRLRPLLLSLVLVAAVGGAAAPVAAQTSPCAGQGGAYPPTAPSLQASATSVRPGDTVVVSGSCLAANATVSLQFRPPPTSLGTVSTDATGSFSVSVTIPRDATVGAHVIAASDGVREVTVAVEVLAADASRGLLPRTGALALAPMVVAAAALIAVGLFAVVAVRRRRALA